MKAAEILDFFALRGANLAVALWPIDRLRPYERNPRTHSDAQVDLIAASMLELGCTNPILVDENAGILAGHGRLLAARRLRLAEVPVIRFEHLSEAETGVPDRRRSDRRPRAPPPRHPKVARSERSR